MVCRVKEKHLCRDSPKEGQEVRRYLENKRNPTEEQSFKEAVMRTKMWQESLEWGLKENSSLRSIDTFLSVPSGVSHMFMCQLAGAQESYIQQRVHPNSYKDETAVSTVSWGILVLDVVVKICVFVRLVGWQGQCQGKPLCGGKQIGAKVHWSPEF